MNLGVSVVNLEKRLKNDYTDLMTISIDPEGAYEIDDALSLERTLNGFRLGAHIADVAALVPIGSELDKIARMNAESLYEPEYIPMFPEEVVSQMSLDENQVRAARSVFFEINRNGQIIDIDFVPSFIKVDRNFTLKEFEYNCIDKTAPFCQIARDYTKVKSMMTKKWNNNPNFCIDVKGKVSSDLVEYFMVLTNFATARHLQREGIPAVRRSHYLYEDGVPELSEDALMLAKHNMAFYTLGSHPHQALGIPDYVHFTSPIRRYADILVQRQLLAMDSEEIGYLTKKSLKGGASHINYKIFENRHKIAV